MNLKTAVKPQSLLYYRKQLSSGKQALLFLVLEYSSWLKLKQGEEQSHEEY